MGNCCCFWRKSKHKKKKERNQTNDQIYKNDDNDDSGKSADNRLISEAKLAEEQRQGLQRWGKRLRQTKGKLSPEESQI